MTGLPTGDLGTSARGESVAGLLSGPFPNTLLLGGLALLVTLAVSLGLGCWAALKPGGSTDRAVSATATGILALPEFVVAVALVLVFALWTGWLPAVTLTGTDGSPASWQMLVLPVLALAVPQIGWNTRIVRAALADEAKAPHVETAVIDGLPRHRVFTHHLLPGATPTIAAGIATSTGMLLGGAVVVETIFNYPGIGSVLASAVADRDSPVVAGVVAGRARHHRRTAARRPRTRLGVRRPRMTAARKPPTSSGATPDPATPDPATPDPATPEQALPDAPTASAQPPSAAGRSRLARAVPRRRPRKGVVLRVLPALLLVARAGVGPWLAPHSIDIPVTAPYAEPGGGVPLGGDQLGRDVLTRLLAGGRELIATSLLVAVLVTAAAALLGAAGGCVRPSAGSSNAPRTSSCCCPPYSASSSSRCPGPAAAGTP